MTEVMGDEMPIRARLEGRSVLITGAASGIGRAMAVLFAQEGAKVALLDRDEDGLTAAAADCSGHPVVIDLAETEQIPGAVEAAVEGLGALDGVVNCAGLSGGAALADLSLEIWSRFIAVNLTAPYAICRAALPHLLKAREATIVNVASGQALLPNVPGAIAYATSKGGLVTFSKALAADLAPKVRVNVICPGVVNTPMTQHLFQGHDNPSDAPWVSQYALHRIAEPEEISQAAVFLTSSMSSYVTGATLAVDGGRTFH